MCSHELLIWYQAAGQSGCSSCFSLTTHSCHHLHVRLPWAALAVIKLCLYQLCRVSSTEIMNYRDHPNMLNWEACVTAFRSTHWYCGPQRTMTGKIMTDLKAQWGWDIRARMMVSMVLWTVEKKTEWEDRGKRLNLVETEMYSWRWMEEIKELQMNKGKQSIGFAGRHISTGFFLQELVKSNERILLQK